jgi:hypothetical protein
MSRSRRKTAVIGMTTAPSDKPFKVDEHRAERHTVRAAVKRSLDGDDEALHSKVYLLHRDRDFGLIAGVAPKLMLVASGAGREPCDDQRLRHP